MNSKEVIIHLKSALNLSSEIFLSALNACIKVVKKENVKFSDHEKFSLLKLLTKFSILYNVPLLNSVLKSTIDFLDESDDDNSAVCEVNNGASTSAIDLFNLNENDNSVVSESENTVSLKASCDQNQVIQYGSGYKLLSKQVRFFKKFNTEGVKMIFQLQDFCSVGKNPLEVLEKVFDSVLKDLVANSVEGSKISFSLMLPNSPHVKPIWSSLKPITQLSGEYIIGLIANVNQSNTIFLSDDVLQLNAEIVNFPFAGGKIDPKRTEESVVLSRKTSVIDVGKDNDLNCLPRSICYGIEITSENFNNRNNLSVLKSLDKLAPLLCKNSNVVITDKGCSLKDIYKFQKFLKNYQIIIFDDLKNSDSILFKLPIENSLAKKNFLYYSKTLKHFYVIKSLTGFFNKKYVCSFCDKLTNVKMHKCEVKCRYCHSFPPCNFVEKVKACESCNRTFRGDVCFVNHIQNKIQNKSVCETFKICKLCSKFLVLSKRELKEHTCNEYFCKNCSKIVPQGHLCYIKRYKGSLDAKFLIIFFDCESTQNTLYEDSTTSYLHIVNLIVAQQICYSCYKKTDIGEKCDICGDRQHVFEYSNQADAVKQFLDYCLSPRPFVSNVYCIAHNLQGYDGHFLISELLARNLKIEPIMNGTKIMKMTCENLIFIDSLNFLAFPLSKFPDVFDIKDYEKGC